MPVIKPDTNNDSFHFPSTELRSKKKNTDAANMAIYPVKKVNAIGSSFGIAKTSKFNMINKLEGYLINVEELNRAKTIMFKKTLTYVQQ